MFTFTHYFSIFIKIFHKSIKSAHVILHNSLRHACIHSFGGTGEMMDGMRNEWKIEKKKILSIRNAQPPCLAFDLRLTIWNWHFERFPRIHLHNRKLRFDPFAISNVPTFFFFFTPCAIIEEREREKIQLSIRVAIDDDDEDEEEEEEEKRLAFLLPCLALFDHGEKEHASEGG